MNFMVFFFFGGLGFLRCRWRFIGVFCLMRDGAGVWRKILKFVFSFIFLTFPEFFSIFFNFPYFSLNFSLDNLNFLILNEIC
jgi:hypothetical protein